MSILDVLNKHKETGQLVSNPDKLPLKKIMGKVVYFKALIALKLDPELIDELMEEHPEDRDLVIYHYTKVKNEST